MRESDAIVAIVHDDPLVREGLSSLIRSAGWKAKTFASAQGNLAYPSAEAPSCLAFDAARSEIHQQGTWKRRSK